MLQRISSVDAITVKGALFSSVIQIGDSNQIHSYSRAIAVQREAELFFGNEGDFSRYSVFTMPIPLPPLEENIVFLKQDLKPIIKVGSIRVLGISASSLLHIGSSCDISLEARVKHIRHLQPRNQVPGK